MTLERLVGPVGVDTFLSEYLGKRPVVIQDAGDFADWFSYDALDELISSRGLRHPTVRLVSEGNEIPPHVYSTGPVPWGAGTVPGLGRPEVLYDLMQRGTSLVFDDLATNWEPVARGARDLEARLGATARAASIFTPPKSQAFTPRYEVHDTFLVQAEGSQHWKVWSQHVAKPLRHQVCPPDGSPTEALLIDQALQKGDVLYIPRGYVHAGQTLDSDSLHIAYGVTPFTWFDVVKSALESFDDPLLDEPVPLAIHREVELDDAADIAFEEMLDRFEDATRPAQAFDRLARAFVRERRSLVRGLSALGDVIEADTSVRRTTGVIDRWVDGTLTFHQVDVDVPTEHVATIRGRTPFPAGSIGLDLSRRLHADGYLEVAR